MYIDQFAMGFTVNLFFTIQDLRRKKFIGVEVMMVPKIKFRVSILKCELWCDHLSFGISETTGPL